MLWGKARSQNVEQVRLSIWKIVVAIWVKSKGWGAFVYFGYVSDFYYFPQKVGFDIPCKLATKEEKKNP